MAFEASVLENGQWTTRMLDVNAVLRHYNQQDQEASENAVEIEKAPVLGLLTQTVIRSPMVHWILPVKLRDLETNHVAFIGDSFVQIKELKPDGYLRDVIRKEDFGARIRNARVVGSTEAFERDYKQKFSGTQIKDENDLDGMDIDTNVHGNPPAVNLLPPQAIVLQLESGYQVFLMLCQSENGAFQFVSNWHRVSKSMLKLQPGAHLAVDPSSRYMAVGCSERVFAIYALKSRADLQEQFSRGSSLRYVEASRQIYPEGVILKIEFLYPSPDDEEHFILLVLVVRKGKTRMLLYEWDTNGRLTNIEPQSRRGHLLEEVRQIPLLIIPLRIKSAFILVSATTMSICRDMHLGSPSFIDINDRIDPPTLLFHGSGAPLWTSWARPVRLPAYTASHDDIYIVREDGFLIYLETDCGEEDLVKSQLTIGPLSCNCGPALACLDFEKPNHTSADLLVTAGDSCAGGAFLIKAREAPKFTESIQNWSPAQDFIADAEDREYKEQSIHSSRDYVSQPDRIFACGGKGANGTITEFRCGFEASLGLEVSYDSQIMDVWVLSPTYHEADGDDGYLFLMSLGDRSSVLRLSSDAGEITELEPDVANFDLASRTITAGMHGQYRIQVTEKSIRFVRGADRQDLSKDALLGVLENGTFKGVGEKIDFAIIHDTMVLFTTSIGRTSYLQIVESRSTNSIAEEPLPPLVSRNLNQYPSNATCLSIGLVAQHLCVIIAQHEGGSIRLVFQYLDPVQSRILDVPYPDDWHQTRLEAFVSIVVLPGSFGHFIIICGTRNGILVTLEVDEHAFLITRSWYDRIGLTSVVVKRNEYPCSKDIVLVNCDLKMFSLTLPAIIFGMSRQTRKVERKFSRIFLTDVLKPIKEQPPINAIARLQPNFSDGSDGGILLVSGSRLLLADLSTQSKAVPRSMPITGSPSRILYSRHLRCLIVAATVDQRSTLLFIDPETGDDLSMPLDKKNGNPVSFVSGLGNYKEIVIRLIEWSYMKGGKKWVFIIVCTNMGRLVILSTQKGSSTQSKGSDQQRDNRIRYWTLHKVKRKHPVYSVAGFDEGLIYCSGEILYCETLDMVEKRFKPVARYTLPSPAVNLAWNDGKIYALTTAHSLEILKLEEGTVRDEEADDLVHKIVRTHGDQVTRAALHHQTLTNGSGPPIELVSDRSCSVVGLWAIHNTRADTLEPVFEAQLPCSIVRFRSRRTRPFQIGKFNLGYQESLGLSIDGSLFSFTVLGFEAWKFLRFMVNLAKQSPKLCEYSFTKDEFSLEPAQAPKIVMQVDGDILRRCLDDGSLEELLQTHLETEVAAATQAKFVELLQELHGEALGGNAEISACIEQAYKDLEFFLRPVL